MLSSSGDVCSPHFCYSSTGVSPFLLVFGRIPKQFHFPPQLAYPAHHLQAKLAELVESNLTAAVHNQKWSYDHHTEPPSFTVGNLMALSPYSREAGSQVGGEWVFKSVKSPVSIEITNKRKTKVVHTNRLRHRHVPSHMQASVTS